MLPARLSGCLATTHGLHLWQRSSQEYGVLQGNRGGIYHFGAQQFPGQSAEDTDPKGDWV